MVEYGLGYRVKDWELTYFWLCLSCSAVSLIVNLQIIECDSFGIYMAIKFTKEATVYGHRLYF